VRVGSEDKEGARVVGRTESGGGGVRWSWRGCGPVEKTGRESVEGMGRVG
jgi:hypothetical protein